MGWLEDLEGQIVGTDTAPIIYFIEAQFVYLPTLKPFFQGLEDDRGFQRVTELKVLVLDNLI